LILSFFVFIIIFLIFSLDFLVLLLVFHGQIRVYLFFHFGYYSLVIILLILLNSLICLGNNLLMDRQLHLRLEEFCPNLV